MRIMWEEILRDGWLWMWLWVLAHYLGKWMDREVMRLREARLKLLQETIDELDKQLALRAEAWEILENLEPAQAEKVWQAIKNRVVENWWPKEKDITGGEN